jgi:osmotically-inducible protein OsmY
MRAGTVIVAAGFVAVSLSVVAPGRAMAAPQAASAAPVDDDALQARIAASLEKSASLAPRHIDVDVDQGVATLTGTVRTVAEKTRAGQLARIRGVTRVDNQIEIDPAIDRSKLDTAGAKTKAGLGKAVDATVDAAKKTKTAVQKGTGKAGEGVAKAADKTSEAVGTAGDKVSDASLTTRVKGAFSDEKALANSSIDVSTTDGVVTLKGTVRSADARARAGVVAGGVKGVTRVINDLVVGP